MHLKRTGARLTKTWIDVPMCWVTRKVTDMTTGLHQLVAKAKESHRAHAIVMTVVAAATLISATAVTARLSDPVLLPATRHEVVTVDARALEAPVLPQSLGYLEYDWSSAEGGVPGFALLSDNSN